jgi:PPOX class probable F420-dependent enzyme
VRLGGERARELFASQRVARLATADQRGRPHLVPLVFVLADAGPGDSLDAGRIYSVIDAKPKSGQPLRRLANIAVNPSVSLLADHYGDDWSQLWWARADGTARVLGLDEPESLAALEKLAQRYPQYRTEPPPGPMIAIDVQRWSGWAGQEAAR